MRSLLRFLRRLLFGLLGLVFLVACIAYGGLRASLPQLDGKAVLRGLGAPVTISRDALGVVSIDATKTNDAARALGYVHAQERFFEMDLMRRLSAGELSELIGAATLPSDRSHRVHRMRARAAATLGAASVADRARLDAYVDGVNQGLNALSARPFPYVLLRTQPAPWTAEDSLLVVDTMFFDLNDASNAREYGLGKLKSLVPGSLYAFLTARGTSWDAPLAGEAFADPEIPGQSEVDLRALDPKLFGRKASVGGDIGIGSNNFGVDGTLTETGSALVANDMHLGLRVPNIWFRARLKFTRDDGVAVDETGVTLPGLPSLVAGSNGHIAWGFTNSYGDWTDWVQVYWTDAGKSRYRTADGEASVRHFDEIIRVHGGADEHLDVRETIYGPILHDDAPDVSLALAWTAHRLGALNLRQADLERAQNVAEALTIAHEAGMPVQNFLVGDRSGALAWTLIGQIPRRSGFDPTLPADWTGAGSGWNGWIDAADYPQLLAPPNHRIWTANARTMSGKELDLEGDGGYALGARAQQIRDGLLARDKFTPTDLLNVQIDDRTLFLHRWWELLRKTLDGKTDPKLVELATLSKTWDEHASIDARSYRYARAFRLRVHAIVLDALAAPARATDSEFELPNLPQAEGIVWKLTQEKPLNFLPPAYADWDALLADAAQRVADELAAPPGGLAARTWGEKNLTRVRHPLSKAVPALSWLLDMPARALPGDSAMPRVQGVSFGASERFAVSPGHEDQGYMHMPGGQSGHPLSPFYGAGHRDWEEARPTTFLPGPMRYSMVLQPGG